MSSSVPGLSPKLPVSVSLGETNEHPYVWIDCTVGRVDNQLVALVPRAQPGVRLQDRLAHGEPGYLVFEENGSPIALRGLLRSADRGAMLEFLMLERGPQIALQQSFKSTEPLLRLMYISRAATDLHDADFYAILRQAAALNTANRVTGALCLDGDFFGQILEGPERAVRDTYERIERDPRHSDPVILVEEPAQHRLYGGWAMKGIHGESAITAADELAARLALAHRADSRELTRRWLELLQSTAGPTWRDAWLAEGKSVLVLRELVESAAPPADVGP